MAFLAARRADVLACLAVFVVATALTATAPVGWAPFLAMVETWAADARRGLAAVPGPAQEDRVVVLTVRLSTLAPYPYMLPFDRGMLADALEALAGKGVSAVGLDILFAGPTEAAKDARLKDVLERFPVPVVVAWAEAGHGLAANEGAWLGAFAARLGKGWPNLVKDDRKTVRWLDTAFGTATSATRQSLAMALATAVGFAPVEGRRRLDYRVAPDAKSPAIPIYPLEAAALMPPAWLADKIVLIGADLEGTDQHGVPGYALGRIGGTVLVPGVVVHAHALSQLLDGRRIPELGWVGRTVVAALAVAAGLATALVAVPAWARVGLGAAAVTAIAGAGYGALRIGGLDLPLVTPVLGYLGAVGAGTAFIGRMLRRDKRFMRDAFSQYVAPAVVAELVKNPGALRLGGERREFTALFSDVAGFTQFSERMDPQVLGELLNRYFDGLCDAVIDNGGTIDKFVGDAIVAIFGAPIAQPDHPRRAVACALAIDRFAEAFRGAEVAKGVAIGITRIGVHTGVATVGNFGGRVRFNYTALGDAMNAASRLEGANKTFGTRIAISATTAARAPDVRLRPIGDIVVKGKVEPVTVYTPILENDPADLVADYAAAYARLAAGDGAAGRAFADLARRFPDDGPSGLHARRLADGAAVGTLITLTEK